MAPADRRNVILDRAAELIAAEGVSAVSMERISREAGVSKALLYKYFANLIELLQALLIREQARLFADQQAAAETAGTLEEIVRRTTGVYLSHVEANGVHIQRLMAEPAVAEAARTHDREGRRRTVAFLTRVLAEATGAPKEIAQLATELSMGMTGVAGELVSRGAADRASVEDLLLCLFRGSVDALRARYGDAAGKSAAG